MKVVAYFFFLSANKISLIFDDKTNDKNDLGHTGISPPRTNPKGKQENNPNTTTDGAPHNHNKLNKNSQQQNANPRN